MSARNRPLNPRRIGVIVLNTFTQLVRMKVFYFMAFFAVILLGSNLLNIQNLGQPDMEGMDVLRNIRSTSLGCMSLFSVVMAIVATALLLPRDVEDRTLYTILAKPVPRLDYLAGKLGGVLLLLFCSLLLMDLLMSGALALRMPGIVADQIAAVQARGWPPDQIEALREETLQQGATWSLHGAVAVVFFRAAILASVSLLVSTLATSTLFTTVIGFLFYFIASFQADAREVYFSSGGAQGLSPFARLVTLLVSLVFPDFSLFNVIDGVIQGGVLPIGDFGMLAGLAAFYVVLHLMVSWMIFAGKEF